MITDIPDFEVALIPNEVLKEYKYNPKALINFLKSKGTVMAPDLSRINETIERIKSNGNLVEVRKGLGLDCMCFGTGWIHGQVLCGQHIPDERKLYITKLGKWINC